MRDDRCPVRGDPRPPGLEFDPMSDFKVGDIVAFRKGIQRVLTFGVIEEITSLHVFISTGKRNEVWPRAIDRIKDPKTLKGKDKLAYHAFLLGVDP